jgi:cullin 3
LLSKNSARNQELQIDQQVEKILGVFRHIKSRDIFETFYGLFLARRLLSDLSASDDFERLMISKWKIECGAKNANKFETMMKDIQATNHELNEYSMSIFSSKLAFKFGAKVVTQGIWPFESRPTLCVLPPEMKIAQNTYDDFYGGHHSGKRLNWKLDKGKVEILAKFDSGKSFELIMTTFQGVILLLFNRNKVLTLSEIADQTQIPGPEIAKQLKSLICAKVIVPTAKNSEAESNQQFTVNENFACKCKRAHLPVPADPNLADSETQSKALSKDRCLVVDATIIKIMKARKQETHDILVTDSIKIVTERFPVTNDDIRSRIEFLIENDYIERSKEERKLYVYKA